MIMPGDEHFMAMALEQARLAAHAGEVPVGAIVVRAGQVVGAGCNAPISTHDPTAHAEIIALRAAAQNLGNYRLEGCDLYVTLEPCAMCAGAMLHARLGRVIFGAPDPRTGAAGSVINLFEFNQINHHTQTQGGVCADECGALLQEFFRNARERHRQSVTPLRDDALRTPQDRFNNLPDYPWPPNYISDLPALNGLRMHYLDVGGDTAPLTFLCLHGNPGWSYLYRNMIPVWSAAGHRIVAPDMPGFGKSDKPKRDSFHTFEFHRQALLEFVERLNLQNIVLVVQDWGGLLGLTLPMAAPWRYCGLLAMNTMLATGLEPLSPGFIAWRDMCRKNPQFDVARLFARGNPHMTQAQCDAYNAPFADAGHRAALRAFPEMVPANPGAPGAAISLKAQEFWQTQWTGKAMMAIGEQDPVLGRQVMLKLHENIRQCGPPMLLPQAGHFVQEHGDSIARASLSVFSAPIP